jgi:16S rRNA (guanine966-N2)-methyltransferase
MRVIAGTYKGRGLVAPEGMNTRPTTDRVKESMFSSLYSTRGELDGVRVLDAFAGSGALGIEALSRGAAFALLCDTDVGARNAIATNARTLGIPSERIQVQNVDVLDGLPRAARPFDVLLLDPPYDVEAARVADLVKRLDAAGMLAPGAAVVYEHRASTKKRHKGQKDLGPDPVDIAGALALRETGVAMAGSRYNKLKDTVVEHITLANG